MLPTVEKTKNMKLSSQKCETTSVPEYSLYLIINAIQKESIKRKTDTWYKGEYGFCVALCRGNKDKRETVLLEEVLLMLCFTNDNDSCKQPEQRKCMLQILRYVE
jgi:hypothetical protein